MKRLVSTKKSRLFVLLALLLVVMLVMVACGSPNSENNDPVADPEDGPRLGGTLRAIRTSPPAVLGYPPEMTSGDDLASLPALEPLLDFADLEDGSAGWGAILAKDWETDVENKAVIFYLQEGVQFHDGTPFNAEAVRWNFQLQLDNNTLAAGSLVDRMEVIDEHTIKIYATAIDNLLWQNWGRHRMISPTAFEEAGEGDIEKSIEWARMNPVGTGPFKLLNYERDVVIQYERNDNYWREGYPYLDAVELRIIPDPSTASMLMEAEQADYWLNPGVLEHARLVENLGFVEHRSDWGMVWALHVDSANPDSPLADIRVRAAVEHALDREAIAEMVGHGYHIPMTQFSPPYELGYDPDYYPRPFDTQKAKDLLTEAGYPNGFTVTIMTSSTAMNRDTLTAIQGYLAAVGITVELDIADSARYSALVFRDGFEGMALAAHGADSTGRSLITHWGPAPRTFRSNAYVKSPEYLAACEKMLTSYDRQEFIEATGEAYRKASEDALAIPVMGNYSLYTAQPYVKTETTAAFMWTSFYDFWLENE
ncbi:MAG: ABC transporter substrate-binding protein [Firmicutes bacterium]|nr:ABC transporter substrate-binding protein [Bacillota bacterium]